MTFLTFMLDSDLRCIFLNLRLLFFALFGIFLFVSLVVGLIQVAIKKRRTVRSL